MTESEQTLAQIERLQDDVIVRLDELNARLEALLRAETPPANQFAADGRLPDVAA